MTEKLEPSKSEAIAPDSSHSVSFIDQIRLEAFGCQGKSTALHPKLVDKLDVASRKSDMDYLNLPIDASDKDVCLSEAKQNIARAKTAVFDFDKALGGGDPEALNVAVRHLHNLDEPITARAARQDVEATMQQAGIAHSWSEDRDLSLFKDSGAKADIITFTGLRMTAMGLEKDANGRIKSAELENVDYALSAILNK